jgi:hypothetical protein
LSQTWKQLTGSGKNTYTNYQQRLSLARSFH